MLLDADAALNDQAERLQALLSVTYGDARAVSALSHVVSAAKRWCERDAGRAGLHLALARLEPPNGEAIRRLEAADWLLRAGMRPRAILQARRLDRATLEGLLRKYSEGEPRVPAGNGLGSGEWTTGDGFLGDLAPELVGNLARFAARFASPAALLGGLFIPATNRVKVSGSVPSLHNLSYVWNRDETHLLLSYNGDDGKRHSLIAQLDGDVFRDPSGKAVARVLPDQQLVIQVAAISAELMQDKEPKLCPTPTPDKPGAKDKDRDYEDYVMRFVNPDNPTPRGFGVQLLNPLQGGKPVNFDDCQRKTGVMVDAKGTTYTKLLAVKHENFEVERKLEAQAKRQVSAGQGRPIIWFFAEKKAAEKAEILLKEYPIRVEFLYWREGMK
ncbi:MAG: hypothetical protein JO303_02625 [Caulobacteraceae bacterium]|nr:hypothetical protein [Caulobacteraceae bacterium]